MTSRKEQVFAICDQVHHDLKLAGLALDGSATDGTLYSSIKAMWSAELGLGRLTSTVVSVILPPALPPLLTSWVCPVQYTNDGFRRFVLESTVVQFTEV